MAVVYTPSSWVTGIVVTDATYCKIPWAALGDAAQNETDIRNILRGLADAIKTHYDTPTPDDTPTKFTASGITRYNESTSEFEENHGWLFDLTVDSTSLASE
jgi:hypothetical protein